MKIYLYLISAILVEILATSSLNSSEGFKKLIPGALREGANKFLI